MEKKKLAIIILAVVLVASGVGNVLFTMLVLGKSGESGESGEILRVARNSNPVTMDPIDCWDRVSKDMLDQVVETLIAYDLSDPNLPLVGRLAESWYWPDNITIEFKLRKNVFFHDGSRFTADCVLHTIARINFFGNWTGTLDPGLNTMAASHSLYKFSDGIPIFNDTLSFATSDYNVSLKLNRPYAPVEGLLGYTASAIVHSDSTPAKEMLDLSEDLVIGTGPFRLVRYIPNSEVCFVRWERYWRTGAYWDQIIYVYYPDAVTAFNALINLEIDWLGQPLVSLKCYGGLKCDWLSNPNITATGDGVHDYINSSVYWYIAFNSEIINRTWRKAISHAFNYTFLIEEIDEGRTVRANSLVPPGFPAHNYSNHGAHYDIPLARTIMQSMGFGYDGPGWTNPWDIGYQVGDIFTPGADEAKWKAAAWAPNVGNFTNNQWNFRLKPGSNFMEYLIQRFAEDMNLIGIEVIPQILTWDTFIDMEKDHPDRCHIYYLGWGLDYFETFNMIEPLVNNESASNYARINDPHVQNLLEHCITETNTTARNILYKRLQGYVIDVQYYHMPLQYEKRYFMHIINLKGVPYNCMGYLYWYPTYWE
ncbi:MAG: ABC transporter substrate-binding protein [Candidatus Odinarchaeota archaeon]